MLHLLSHWTTWYSEEPNVMHFSAFNCIGGEKRTLQVLLVKRRRSDVNCLIVYWSTPPAQCLLCTCDPNWPFLTRGDRLNSRWRKELVSAVAWKNRVQTTSSTLPGWYDCSLCRLRRLCLFRARFFARINKTIAIKLYSHAHQLDDCTYIKIISQTKCKNYVYSRMVLNDYTYTLLRMCNGTERKLFLAATVHVY